MLTYCPMDAAPFTRALVVVNPIAGRGRADDHAQELARGLEGLGAEVEIFRTGARGDAAAKVAELAPGVDLVVVVGGDGTLGEVLSKLPTRVPVAMLPMGTANVMAMDLRLPRRVPALLQAIAAGRTVDIDTARVNGRLSFLVLGVGFDGEIVRDVDNRRRGPITKAFYLRSVLRCLWRNRPPELHVWVDGESVPGNWGWVLVSNIVGYGGILKLSPDRLLDDGLYEVYLFPRGTRRALLGYGLLGLLGRLPGRSCKMVRAKHVRVESDHPVPYEVDGDFGGETPVEFEVVPGHHQLIVP